MAKYAWIVFLLLLFLFSCNYVTYDQFKLLEDRVYSLENAFAEHEKRITYLESNVEILSNNLSKKINDVKIKLDELNRESDIDYLKSYTHEIAIEVSKLQNQFSKVTAELTAYNLKNIIYRINSVEGLVEKLDLKSVSELLDEAISKYNNGYSELLGMEEKINEIELTIEALESTISELNSVTSTSGNGGVVNGLSVDQILKRLKKLEDLEKEIENINMKINHFSSGENLERELAIVKQINSELSFLIEKFSQEDIIDILKLRSGYINYIIRPGDTLYLISKKYNLGKDGVQKIIEFNAIKNPNHIIPGQTIKIPINNVEEFIKIPVKIRPENIVSYFGEDKSGIPNLGIDIEANGALIYPILPGRVTVVGDNILYIDHGNGILGVYKGIVSNLKEKDWVVTDKALGKSEHIFHFEIWVDGEPKDPLRFLFRYKGKFDVTFYTPWDDGKIPEHPTFRLTRSGSVAKEWVTAAVDPSIIPLGNYIYIPQLKKFLIAEDTGSLISGKRIDIYIEEVSLARKNSIKKYDVYVLENGGS